MKHTRYCAPFITTAAWIRWEIANYLLEHETPGKFGYFTAAEAAK